MADLAYKRVLLKLSGEAMAGDKKTGIDADVLGKKKAAEEYCKNASEFTKTVGGKPWKYVLLAHDTVDRAASFKYLTALG